MSVVGWRDLQYAVLRETYTLLAGHQLSARLSKQFGG